MYTVIKAFDPREIIVIGFTEMELDKLIAGLRIDVKERLANPLDDVIEPEIGRTFGLLGSYIVIKPGAANGMKRRRSI